MEKTKSSIKILDNVNTNTLQENLLLINFMYMKTTEFETQRTVVRGQSEENLRP